MIVQFGTSRFLQAHVDLFATEAAESGQVVPGITIVQTTGDPARGRRLAALADPAGFPILVRGLENGAAIEREHRVHSVRQAWQAAARWADLRALVRDEATYIISNTGDEGYTVLADDLIFDDMLAPSRFVAMLVALLHGRWYSHKDGVTLLPCELVPRNGDTLRTAVVALATAQERDKAFIAWLAGACIWTNTLVDRIVSAAIEPAGAIAEPYALWAIERRAGLVPPFEHPALILTEQLAPFERLKLHILNLGHSWLADRWDRAGRRPGLTVRGSLLEPETSAAWERLLNAEIVPGFAARGMETEALAYAAKTLERFGNPFLDHLLADIHSHHDIKIERRVAGFMDWVGGGSGIAPAMPELRRLADGVETLI